MTTTYTTNLTLAKPGQGDSNWNITWNQNLDDIDTIVGNEHNSDGTHKAIVTTGLLEADGTIAGATSQAQDFGTIGIKTDVIAESTLAAGVTIDSVLVKDGQVDGVDISAHSAATSAHGVTGTLVGTTDTQTLTNKTITTPIYTGIHDFGSVTSMEVPNGAGGTLLDAAGEVDVDTTSATFNFHDGVGERVINPVLNKAFTIKSPTATEDTTLWSDDKAITITKIIVVLVGTTPSVTWTIRHGTDRSLAGAEVVTGGTTTTSITTGDVVTTFNDATVVADSFVWLETTAQSGTVDSLNVTIFYRQDA